jgi:hypothetical protein
MYAGQAAEAKAETDAQTEPEDEWLPILAAVRGDQNKGGTSYVSTNMLLEILGVDRRDRKAGTHKRIASLMTSLHWMPTRMFGLNAHASLSQVRGYCRDDRHEQRRQPLPQVALEEQQLGAGG